MCAHLWRSDQLNAACFAGKKVRGPAPLSLALAHVNINADSGAIDFVPWTETDFRTGEAPWWKA